MAAEEPQQEPGPEIQIELPPELENGIYANFAIVHHTQHEVTIDFCQLGVTPPEPDQDPRAKVVARVHVAPTFVMPLLQAIATNLGRRDEILREIDESSDNDA